MLSVSWSEGCVGEMGVWDGLVRWVCGVGW